MPRTITVPNLDDAFKAPAQSAGLLLGALDAVLREAERAVLGTVLADSRPPRDGEILPELRRIRRKQWTGAWTTVEAAAERYRQQAQAALSEFAAAAEASLRTARVAEQRQWGPLRASSLYVDVTASISPSMPDAAGDWAALLKTLQGDEDFKADDQAFRRVNDRLLRGPGARRARYDVLQARCLHQLRTMRDHINASLARALLERLATHVQARITAIVASREAMVRQGSAEARRARRQARNTTEIARGRTAADHYASMPPSRSVIETRAACEPYFAAGAIDSGAFLKQFGAWASERDLLPADEVAQGKPSLAQAIRRFTRARMEQVFQDVDLATLYEAAPLPVAELVKLSGVALRTMPGAEFTAPAQLVQLLEAPAGLDVSRFDDAWQQIPGQERNRMRLLQDLRGISPWTFLGLPDATSEQALNNTDAVLREVSIRQLGDAVRNLRVVERLRGEVLDANRNTTPAATDDTRALAGLPDAPDASAATNEAHDDVPPPHLRHNHHEPVAPVEK